LNYDGQFYSFEEIENFTDEEEEKLAQWIWAEDPA